MSLRRISSFQSHSFVTNAIKVSVLRTISLRFDRNAQFHSLSLLPLMNSAVKYSHCDMIMHSNPNQNLYAPLQILL